MKISEMAGWDIANHFGCCYSGDSDPIDHGGYFYSTKDWEENGYAECVVIWRNPDGDDEIWVESGTINKTDDLVECFESCGFKIDPEDSTKLYRNGEVDIDRTPAVEIECTKAHWGSETHEDHSGRFVKVFKDGTDEDEIWEAIKGWIRGLGG